MSREELLIIVYLMRRIIEEILVLALERVQIAFSVAVLEL